MNVVDLVVHNHFSGHFSLAGLDIKTLDFSDDPHIAQVVDLLPVFTWSSRLTKKSSDTRQL